MTVFILRVFLFSLLPLLLSAGILLLDRSASTRERRLEIVLILLFGVGVAGSGIASFFGHLFLPDVVADSVGWPRGSPFQLEMAFANLILGLLGIVATSRRDGFREATVIAVTVLGVGASIVHLIDILATGNLAPGNTVQNIANLIKPVFLIPLLIALRRAERSPNSEALSPNFNKWRIPLLQIAAIVAVLVSTAFGLGYALGLLIPISVAGIICSIAITAIILARSPAHRKTEGTIKHGNQ
jgi:hypothetical protein